MKLLFTAGGSQAAVFGAAPLATAARSAGHEVLLACDEPMMAAAESIALPAVSITSQRLRYGQDGVTASDRLDALLALAGDWPPDLVVGALSHVPRLAAARLDVPFVRQVWHIAAMARRDRKAVAELAPELTRLGLAALPEPAMFIDVCPPSLRSPASPRDAQTMRWVPRNSQRRLQPWMYTRPTGRRRVLITAGSRTLMMETEGWSMRRLVDDLTGAGAEVLIAAPDEAAAAFGAEFADVRIGWIPLDVIAPTLDLAVHHGGATTATTLLNAGVPQLIIPDNGYGAAVAQALADFGAALMLTPHRERDTDPGEAISAGCREILADPGYRRRVRMLADEMATLPTPGEVVGLLEKLAG